MRVRVLPGVPISFTICDLRLTIFAALVQRQETLRSERGGWGWKSLTRHHFAHGVQRRDGALKTREVSVQIRPWAPPRVAQGRGVPLKTERLQVQVLSRGPIWPEPESSARGSGQAISWLAVRPRVRRSERQHQFWNVHRSSAPGLGANECVPSSKWCKSTAFRHSCACSSKSNRQFYKLSRTR